MTNFTAIYNRFLGKITDDMYMELTPEDTVKDLQKLLIDSIPGFEFPRKNLYDYTIKTEIIVPKTAMNISKMIIIISISFMTIGVLMVGYFFYKKYKYNQ